MISRIAKTISRYSHPAQKRMHHRSAPFGWIELVSRNVCGFCKYTSNNPHCAQHKHLQRMSKGLTCSKQYQEKVRPVLLPDKVEYGSKHKNSIYSCKYARQDYVLTCIAAEELVHQCRLVCLVRHTLCQGRICAHLCLLLILETEKPKQPEF